MSILVVNRERPHLLIAGIALALLLSLVALRIPVTMVFVALMVMVAAVIALIRPEIGLHVLVFNAMVGLTHIVEMPSVGPFSAPVLIEALVLGAIFFQVAFFGRRVPFGTRQHLLLGLLAGWIFLSILTGVQVGPMNFREYRNLFLVRLIIFFIVSALLSGLPQVKRLVVTLMVSNVGLLGVAAAVRLGYFGQQKITISQNLERTGALVQNPNELAFSLTTMLVLTLCAFLYVRSRILKTILLGMAAANLFVSMSTLSRSGFISLCVVLLFVFFKLTRNLRAVVVMLLLALGGWLMMPDALFERFSKIDEVKDVDRLQIARVGVAMTLAHPMLGVGLGNYESVFRDYNVSNMKRVTPSHNMYLDLAAQMGTPALILYMGVFFITWRGLRRMETELKAQGRSRSFTCLFGLAVQAFFVNLAIFGMSGDVEFDYSAFVMLGMALALLREHAREHEGGLAGASGRN